MTFALEIKWAVSPVAHAGAIDLIENLARDEMEELREIYEDHQFVEDVRVIL